MKSCPHCKTEIIIKELPHQGLFDSNRICPECCGSFTVDADTKQRQYYLIIIILISLIFTLFLYFDGNDWLVPAIISYIVFTALLYWGNKKLYYVPYKKDDS